MDIAKIKADFPLFQTYPQLAYLDSAATSQKPQTVIDAVAKYYIESNANVHRGIYKLAEKSTKLYEDARETVREFIHASSTKEIVFTRNATEAINLVAQTWGGMHLDDGNVILISSMEHHANIVPWQLACGLKSARGVDAPEKIKPIRLTDDFRLDLEDLKQQLFRNRVALVAVNHASNVLGTINPIKAITKLAHEYGAKVLVDGCQAVPHIKVDVQDIDADFYVFSAHKMLGPTGVGVLYGKQELFEAMPAYLGGGEMIDRVQLAKSTWNELPWKFEAGTPNMAGVAGLQAAIEYINNLRSRAVILSEAEESPAPANKQNSQTREFATSQRARPHDDNHTDPIFVHEQALGTYTLEQLHTIKGLKIYGPQNMTDRLAVFSFTLDGMHAHDIASVLDEQQIAVRAGHHCAMPLHEQILRVPATTRVSLYLYNSKDDIDRLIENLEKAKKILG